MNHVAYAVAAWLFLIGLYGVMSSRHLVHQCLCLSVVQASTYVLLAATAYRRGTTAPFFLDRAPGTPVADPVLQALMLTDVVVEAAVIALLLALAVRIHRRRHTVDPNQAGALRG